MNTAEQALLEIRDLCVVFDLFRGTAPVLDHVSLLVHRGEKVGLAGETGCGKSVTMKTIIGILPIPPGRIAGGEILFNGVNILSLHGGNLQNLRGRIALIPQDPSASLNPVFRIGTQLRDAIKYSHGCRKLSAKEIQRLAVNILGEVGLPDPERVLHNYPFQLSGGMKQRVLIAMALAGNPELLIADEPTTALDVTIQAQVLNLMREAIDRRNLSILMITHNLGLMREFVDRVYIMYAGQIVETASTKELFNRPLHPYSKGLIASVPKITGEGIPPGIPGTVPDYLNVPVGCRFSTRCDKATEVCAVRRPEIVLIRGEHYIACHLYNEERRDDPQPR